MLKHLEEASDAKLFINFLSLNSECKKYICINLQMLKGKHGSH